MVLENTAGSNAECWLNKELAITRTGGKERSVISCRTVRAHGVSIEDSFIPQATMWESCDT